MSDRDDAPLLEIARTSRGYAVYRQDNGAGGQTYWCDDIGGGRVVWDTCLGDVETLAIALRDALPAAARWRLAAWIVAGLEPTREMHDAAVRSWFDQDEGPLDLLRTMLAAAKETRDGS